MVPVFSKGDKMALHGCVLFNPAALQGLLPAARVLLVKQNILPAEWLVMLKGAAVCQCGLTSFLNDKTYMEQGALLLIKAVLADWALPTVWLCSIMGLGF